MYLKQLNFVDFVGDREDFLWTFPRAIFRRHQKLKGIPVIISHQSKCDTWVHQKTRSHTKTEITRRVTSAGAKAHVYQFVFEIKQLYESNYRLFTQKVIQNSSCFNR